MREINSSLAATKVETERAVYALRHARFSRLICVCVCARVNLALISLERRQA